LKKIIFLSLALLLNAQANAQSVDESVNGLQVGFLGIWLHNESKIAPNWAFHSEIGFEAPVATGLTGNIFPVFTPTVTLEGKWYYKSPKRQGNSRNYFHNSSNFATIGIKYIPEFSVIGAYRDYDFDGGIFLIPSWGIRRNLSYRLNYELGIGFGFDVYEILTAPNSTTDFIFNAHIRVGYKFGKKAFQ